MTHNARTERQRAAHELTIRNLASEIETAGVPLLAYGIYPAGGVDTVLGGFASNGQTCSWDAALLVGANPAMSPNRTAFEPYATERIQTFDDEFNQRFEIVTVSPDRLSVSDRAPSVVSVLRGPSLLQAGRLDTERSGVRALVRYRRAAWGRQTRGMMVSDHSGHAHESLDTLAEGSPWRPLAIAFALTTTFLIIEIIGGILTNSLALLADASHMATDALALALALFTRRLARRPPSVQRSFGYLRAEILAALFNASLLIAITIYIFWKAYQRLAEPPEVQSGAMLVVATAGLAANAASAWVLSRGGGETRDVNTRGALLNVIGDMLGSVGAIAAALIMLATGWYLADPILSAGIGALILWSSWRLLRETIDILLEATPAGVNTDDLRAAMLATDGVEGVHDLHIWTVTSGMLAMSGHVETNGARDWYVVLGDLSTLLRDRFGIAHVTLQPEPRQA